VKALLLENIHRDAVRLLEEAGLEVTQRPSALGEAELSAALTGVGLLGIRSKTQLSAAVLSAARDLLAVGAFCIGTDQIDLAAASALGLAVFNAPYSNTRSVVELTLAEIIALTRRLTEKDRGMHAGVWDKSASGAHEVRGRTLGIVSRMRPGALFLNLCRGFVIDHDALRRHLLSGQLAGAAVDVFRDEPRSAGEEFESVLRGLPNVILTPHIGGSTEEAQADIGAFVGGKLADFVADGATSLSVNLPQVALPPATGTHRLAHIHRNVPGVMAEINSVLAAHDVNVEAQLLGTRGELGYALTDIGIDYPDEVLERLREMAPTVRLRVLS
jgi:D-3-phosphoglycerate dehydrogenase